MLVALAEVVRGELKQAQKIGAKGVIDGDLVHVRSEIEGREEIVDNEVRRNRCDRFRIQVVDR